MASADNPGVIIIALVCLMMIAGIATGVRPPSPRQWALVWVVLVILARALVGVGWLRSG